ncbi:pyrimidine-nucleoside phosphorylase [Desulfitibacter alkalitolerans]|uniref:pyrimidine-nucleoside phosphorylase n=1 Tax=Desulfitibacter alkalitolerans TaxID=264641 RepID=UPI000480EE5F|nr:pyrimidine-nucleoside phosphorylase [Desulfitibacter alkalitolerans]
MRAHELILKKRNGHELTREEINYLIDGFVKGSIPDYQIAAWSMAVYFQGLSEEETIHLTESMVNSGDTIDLSPIPGCKVDKHSTGGVADTTTLILVPLVAAAGVPVVKMSGRGLGHTGGTIDKLEAIPGFNVELEIDSVVRLVKKTGAVIAGQTGNLVPADKKLYSLRDVTATVDIVSLIASSVMSKKIAAGADKILLDVKVGKGAFMKSQEQALELAKTMVKIGAGMNRETTALITNMDQPLGMAIGNALEVKEAILTLRGDLKGDLYDLSIELASEMLLMAKAVGDKAQAKALLIELIEKGRAIEKLVEIIENQGGNPGVVEDLSILPHASTITPVLASMDGYIWELDAEKLGRAAMVLGAGREYKEQSILLEVGVTLKKRIGDAVTKGECIADVHSMNSHNFDAALRIITDAVRIKAKKPREYPLVFGKIAN